ncbi:HutD family protein, partial [Pseudomonas aeruginosa]
MSELRILRAVDYPRMPWKNGAGSTEEIARDGGDGLDG